MDRGEGTSLPALCELPGSEQNVPSATVSHPRRRRNPRGIPGGSLADDQVARLAARHGELEHRLPAGDGAGSRVVTTERHVAGGDEGQLEATGGIRDDPDAGFERRALVSDPGRPAEELEDDLGAGLDRRTLARDRRSVEPQRPRRPVGVTRPATR